MRLDEARTAMQGFRELPPAAHAIAKRRIRRSLIRRIRVDVWLDLIDAILLGIRGGGPKTR